jgi:poly(beta-D-mannuronate) lyase
MFDSKTTVENNVFEHCNGEIEIISNKSCKNILRNNLFYECAGTLTLRHGNDAEVYGNYFIGNGLPNTGGIRVIGENHRVHDNYFQDLTGTGLMGAISVMDGLPNPVLTSHWQVKNASIYKNIIINCKENFVVGAGKNSERYLPALNTSFTGNIIYTDQQPVTWMDETVKISFADNVLLTKATTKPPDGFIAKEIKLKKNSIGLFEVNGKDVKPFWLTENIGPSWKEKRTYPIGIK